MSVPFLIRSYALATAVCEPALVWLLHWRRRQGREDGARIGERQGHPSRARPNGNLVWVHGASIGETLSLLPIVERLTQRGLSVLVTSGTKTSAALIARRLPPGALHQFVPLDVPRYVARFLDYWQPDFALVAESEIWPNTIMALHRREIPLVLVNGRISDRSFRRWMRLPRIIGALLDRFAICLAQTHDDAERLIELGAPRVVVTGNLKFDSPPPPADPRLVAFLSGLVAGRPVWLAASTHPGEEEVILAVHQALAGRHPFLLTVIAPRHPHRGADVAALAQARGLRVGRRSEGIHPDRAIDVYIADTVGEMGLLYRLSPIAIMGGSLVTHGGQNPIEPAKLGTAILYGPHVQNFEEIYESIADARGAVMVRDSASLVSAVSGLFGNPALTRDMARSASDAVQALGGAVERTMQTIEPFIVQAKLGTRR